MKKIIVILTVLILSGLVFTGCTKTSGDSVSSINPSITVEVPVNTTTTEESTEIPALEQGNSLDELEKDLNNSDFSNVDIEIDSSL